MHPKLKAYLQLCRPANLPTAAADILAGAAIGGYFSESQNFTEGFSLPYWLVLASILLYATGVVLNDYFDAGVDALERPERPIPKGVVSKRGVLFFGLLLMVLGILCAFVSGLVSGLVAITLALSILAYDGFSKKNGFLGPLNMGVCRGLNLLLGISAVGMLIQLHYFLIPLIFIAAVTLISRGEVHGKNKRNILVSAFLYVLVVVLVIGFESMSGIIGFDTIPFLLLFVLMVFLPLIKAYRTNISTNIMKAVKFGVLALVPLDAAITAGHAGWQMAILVLLLLPLSFLLSKLFAVT